MHYDTNDKLKTVSPTIADVLAPNTGYIAYIFTEKQITQRIPFTTEAIPPVGDAKWEENIGIQTPVDKLNFTLSIPSDEIVSVELGETLLLPLYTKNSARGYAFVRPDNRLTVSCSPTPGKCLGSVAGYTNLDTEVVFAGNNNYQFNLYRIVSVATIDLGRMVVKIGSSGATNLTLSTD